MDDSLFVRHCPIRIMNGEKIEAMGVKTYLNEEDYTKEMDIMASAFEHLKDAMREAKRVAKMSQLPYVGIVK